MRTHPVIRLFFIGDNFYHDSSTIMSPVYEARTKKRWDWGFIQLALAEGKRILIRPATKREMKWARAMLSEVVSNFPKSRGY